MELGNPESIGIALGNFLALKKILTGTRRLLHVSLPKKPKLSYS